MPTTPLPPLPPRTPQVQVIDKRTTVILPSHTNVLSSPVKVSLPALPPSTIVGNWILTEHSFAPQREYLMDFCKQLAPRRVVDHLMWFKFLDSKMEPVAVHYSRLALAGGPMAELLLQGKKVPTAEDRNPNYAKPDNVDESTLVRTPESPPRNTSVLLSSGDSPRIFNIIVKYLYCEEIMFNYLTFQELVHLANDAHRWVLTDMYQATLTYVMDQNMLAGGLEIRPFIPLVNHLETPEAFRRYFCIAVGHRFDVLYPRLKALLVPDKSAPLQLQLAVPPLWDVVIARNILSHVIHCISLYSKSSYDPYLLDVILRYYEPVQKADDDILGILSQLNWDEIKPTSVFDPTGPCKNWSRRAIRLAALASYAPPTDALEVRIPSNIPLQSLLKQDQWSFQTEHVLCGPYLCYLHLRKGSGPEVSLYVHIWYGDGKPILDDARHESVRVMCRATEKNCHCDSGKQWSYSLHGFLENLNFEGKLEGYPGWGWSQFLEKRRLEEWRSSHGEQCGLSITTVLQFMRPRKQFEGPASIIRSRIRASSQRGVSSSIVEMSQ